MLRTLFMITAATAWLAAGPAAADVYKFKDDKGNVLYTDKPATLPAERLNIQSQKTDTVAVQTRQQEELKRLQDADQASQQASQRRPGSAAGRADERDPEGRPVRQGAPALRQLHEFAAALSSRVPTVSAAISSDAELTAARASAKASMDVMCK